MTSPKLRHNWYF